jgi:hypothetical protein
MKRLLPFLAAIPVALVLGSSALRADQQTLQLQQTWNLFSLYLTPSNPAVSAVFSNAIAANRLRSVFTYEHEGSQGVWKRFYPNLAANRQWLNTLTNLRPYQGYWVNLSTGPPFPVSITGQFSTNLQRVVLQPGWHLIGLGNDQPVFWADGFGSMAGGIQALFVYDVPTLTFHGFRNPQFLNVDVNGDGAVKPNEWGWVYTNVVSEVGAVRTINPGQALWVKVSGPTVCGPALEVEVESDVDPFPPGASTNRWFEPGTDTDLNGNGRLDYGFTRVESLTSLPVFDRYGNPYVNTQDTISFRVPTGAAHTNLAILQQQITLLNLGRGILHYQIEEDLPWLVATPASGRIVQGVAGQTVTLLADIAGLPPGETNGVIRIRSNGGQKQYNVRLTVPGLGGIYSGEITIAEVSGRPAIPRRWPVRLTYQPGGFSVLHAAGSPHLPGDVSLANFGSVTQFDLAGLVVTEANDPQNPYGIRFERMLRLQGGRVDVPPGTVPGQNLGLRGSYEETLTGFPGGTAIVTRGVFFRLCVTLSG